MARLAKETITRLATVAGLSLNVATKQTLITVPTGVNGMVVTKVVFRNASASAAAATAALGGNASANDWKTLVNFTNLTTTTRAITVTPETINATPVAHETFVPGTAFGIDVGTLAAVTVTCDVFGYYF